MTDSGRSRPGGLWTIQQVSRNLEVSRHTLRFWEKELTGLVVPLRSRGGQRRYAARHVALLARIKGLRERGLSLAEIRWELEKGERGSGHKAALSPAGLVAERLAEVVRAEVHRLFAAGSMDPLLGQTARKDEGERG